MTTEQKLPANETIGNVLRKARERKGLKLSQLSRQLRLPVAVVEHIENDRLDELAPIYRRGYIRNYARQVGVDEHAVLSLIDESSGNEPELREVLPTPRGNLGFEQALRGASYLLVTAVIVLPLVWMFVESGARFFEPAADKEIKEASLDSTSSSEDGDDRQRDEDEPGAVSQRLAYALSVDEPGRVAGQPSHLSASTIPLRSRGTDEEPVANGAGSQPFELSGPAAAPLVDAPTPLRSSENYIDLVLEEDSWVEIRDGNGVRVAYDLASAGSHRFEGKAPFSILLGRAEAARLQIDGEPVEFSSMVDGNVARFELQAGGEIRQ